MPLPTLRTPDERALERARLCMELGIPEERRLVLAVGNLYPVKDHATLLRAGAGLEGVHVLIAGRGPELEGLASLARALGAASRVHLLGLRSDVARLLAAADLLVHPSRAEGLPLAILEAMAAALPVVASRVGGSRRPSSTERPASSCDPAIPTSCATRSGACSTIRIAPRSSAGPAGPASRSTSASRR